ncbi:MAG: tyrosine-type recombinase/integrase [Bacillota bacterium]
MPDSLNPGAERQWQQALEQFLWFKKAQGSSETTIEDYHRFVMYFFQRYAPSLSHPPEVKTAAYKYLSERVKPATYNLRLNYLKGFFSWCVREGILPENALDGFRLRRAEGRTVMLQPDTLQRLLALPDQATPAGLRDYTLMLLTLDTGLRPREAFQILITDVDLERVEVRVRGEVAKTRRTRVLPMSPVTAAKVRELIAVRNPSWPDTVPLFCTRTGKPLNRDSWGDRLTRYSRILGVTVRPYDLRHSFAVLYLRSGAHAFALQRMLGHTTMAMTRRYVHLTSDDLREQHLLASPVARYFSPPADIQAGRTSTLTEPAL